MVDEAWVRSLVHNVMPEAEVHPVDLTGGGDHWYVAIVADAFEGLRTFQRQRPFLQAVTPHIQAGTVHAFDLKCITPGELRERHDGVVPAPFVPHDRGQGDHPGAWS